MGRHQGPKWTGVCMRSCTGTTALPSGTTAKSQGGTQNLDSLPAVGRFIWDGKEAAKAP